MLLVVFFLYICSMNGKSEIINKKLEVIKPTKNNTIIIPDGKEGIIPFYVYDGILYITTSDIMDKGDNDFFIYEYNVFVSPAEGMNLYKKGEIALKTKVDYVLFLSIETDLLDIDIVDVNI